MRLLRRLNIKSEDTQLCLVQLLLHVSHGFEVSVLNLDIVPVTHSHLAIDLHTNLVRDIVLTNVDDLVEEVRVLARTVRVVSLVYVLFVGLLTL